MTLSELSNTSFFGDEILPNDLLRFFTSRLKCAETAADLTHETYLRLDEKVKLNPPDNARALAVRIALNLAMDYQGKVVVRNCYASNIDYDVVLEIRSNQTSQSDRTLIAKQQLAILNKVLV